MHGNGIVAPPERLLCKVGAVSLGADPGLGLLQKGMHLRQERARRRALALERFDPLEPLQYGAGFVHDPTDASGETRARV